MKIRNGFVSNSSSSSFVILKDSLSEIQRNMILNYQKEIEFFISKDEEDNWKDYQESHSGKYIYLAEFDIHHLRLKYVFDYYDTDPWRIIEYEDCIFGETSMDNFNMRDFFNYIKVDDNYIYWDDGYIDNPTSGQRSALVKMKQEYRKEKLNKINKI
jgi:hypothetical protein